jgi:alpha-glucosidase
MNSVVWWHNAAIYQVYPRSFFDGNGDSIGDLEGVIDKLPYLSALGVEAIWLSPFYPSPQHDSGYDVANPRDVDPMYGNLSDAERLIAKAHQHGLKLIVDLVPNHFSIEHPWFQEALMAEPGSQARMRFHFLDSEGAAPPNNWVSMFGGPAWTRVPNSDGSPGQWYLHIFDSSQPDLNWTNPEVAADWIKTLRFWLDMGVDGFRVDVAHGLAKDMTYANLPDPVGLTESLRFDLDDGSPEAADRRGLIVNSGFFDRDELQDIYATWRSVMDEYPGDRMSVAEAWVPPHRASRYVAPTSLHQIFGFDFLVVSWNAAVMRSTIDKGIAAVATVGAPPTWALSNHDSPRVVTRLGGGELGRSRARALALLTHALPGAVYVFQGEELGLEDVDLMDKVRQDPVFYRTKGAQKGRDAARVPLPWAGSSPPYAFTSSTEPTWLPQPLDWGNFTAAAQELDSLSTLSLYRASLHMRKNLSGPIAFKESGDSGVLIFSRDNRFHCAINTGPDLYDMSERFPTVEVILSSDMQLGDKDKALPPNCCVWFATD